MTQRKSFRRKMDKLAALLHGERGALKNTDNPQSRVASRNRFSSRPDAIRKMLNLYFESLRHVQLGSEHVTGAITH